MKLFLASASTLLLTAPMALAQQTPGGGQSLGGITSGGVVISLPSSTMVPEISALEGTAALAVLAAVLLLVWERRRRAA